MIPLLLLLLAGDPLPSTPAAVTFEHFLDDYNSGELQKRDPGWARWYALYGKLRYESVGSSAPDDIRVWTKSEVTDSWVGIHVVMDPKPPHAAMRDIGVVSGHHPINASRPAPLPDGIAAVDAYLQRLAGADAFSGVVLIAKNGTPVYEKAFGLASRRYSVPNDVDTRFNIASVTKLITAVAIVQLAESGKLAYSDPVAKYLQPSVTSATVEQLLTHTASFGRQRELFTDRFGHTVAEQAMMISGHSDFPPGTNIRYSNEGYILLGAIVEKAGGEAYDDYVARHIYAPLGMKGSGTFDGDREVPNVATGYTRWRWRGGADAVFEPGERRNTSFMTSLRGNPSGGTYATAHDLFRLMQGIESCTIVTCASRDLMFRRQAARPKPAWSGTEEGYGYGMETKTYGKVELVGKSGKLMGASSQMDLDRRRGIVVIVLSNYDEIASPVAEAIEDMLLR